jgi:hypothetical protein
MRHIYLTLVLALIAATSTAQTYNVSTASNSGNWTDQANWGNVVRTDGRNITTIVIPRNITVTLNDDVDLTAGTVELEIEGTLELKSDNSLFLSSQSIINVRSGGAITLHASAMNQSNDKKMEQIFIGNVVKFDGNESTLLSGPATASSLTGNSPNGFSSNAMLPVNFVSFTASKSDESIGLTWTTTDEINNSHFEIQRSVDGINFKTIAIMMPAEDLDNMHQYNYTDNYSDNGTVYYRIRQLDNDGKEKFSSVKVLGGANKTGNAATIYATSNKLVVVDLQNVQGFVMVRLVSLSGTIVKQLSAQAANQKITINAYNAASGAYVVQVSDSKGMFNTKKVLL